MAALLARAGPEPSTAHRPVPGGRRVLGDHYTPTGTTPGVVSLPFTEFRVPSWATPATLDLTQVTQLSLYVGGAPGTGTLRVDSFEANPIA
ncbi:MAG TPA: hypothetical protein VK453_02020 [Micromonosporaceae bacterium]|nr:hypothetical protein [Micromonosporaceae bacterium]